ncbi:MAG: biotin carboxylase N-terminal domain-containing protein [Polyangiales bacterium]
MFHRLFIANRGEVAVRIARTCDAMGVTPVFGVSSADQKAGYVEGRESVLLGAAAAKQSYLDVRRVVNAARETRCTALHPGWGFLSENPLLARMCEDHGITFVGPPAHVMHLMGTKTPAKRAMAKAGLTLIPGSDGVLASADEARRVADEVGYPVLLKAEHGGGGRGMRIARSAKEVEGAFADATAEALAAFGDGSLYLEKLVEGGRHVEIQLLGDRYGHVVHVGERDCTVQRNHQKLIEESPSPALPDAERTRVLELARGAARDIGYVGAGTMEFLLDDTNTLRFMEMNTRLQVEHCVSEVRSGLDLVREQLRVAAGHALDVTQENVALRGHAIECRINAEDPEENFRPSPGTLAKWTPPSGEGIRVDTHAWPRATPSLRTTTRSSRSSSPSATRATRPRTA